ncbi:MAG: selenium metabolism-associated LysR family transcriptional regulator [Bacillota bacterium]
MNLHLSHLKTFAAVIQFRSISRAAAELHLSQPAVTKHVQALESHYGRPLLERTGREASPTDEGIILNGYILELMHTLDLAEAAIAETGKTIRGHLHLGASTIPGQYILPHVISAFRQLYPSVEYSLEIADTEQITWKVAESKVDVGVVGSPVMNPKVESFPFVEDELVVVMAPNHPLAGQERLLAKDLVGQPLVWRRQGSGTRKTVEERLAKAGLELDPARYVLEAGSTETVVTAVEAGLGLSVVSRWAILKSAALGTLIVRGLEDVSLKRILYAVYPRHGLSRAARTFVDFIRGDAVKEALAQVPPLFSQEG